MRERVLDYPDVPLFRNIAEPDLRSMLRCLRGHEKQFKKGEILIMDEDHVIIDTDGEKLTFTAQGPVR